MSKIVGIDLGTTNSVVAVMEGGRPKVIPAADTGRNITPSVVEPEKNLVGDVAKRQVILNPKHTVYSVKRLMGRRDSDKEVERTKKMVPYSIKAGKDGMAVIAIEDKEYSPQEISARILMKLKKDAEAYLGEKVDSAVIHLFFKEIEIMDEMKSLFIQVVKASFGNRRKTLKNSLSNSIFGNINFEDSGIDLTKRAEQLDIEDFLKLSEFLRNYNEK